MFYKVTKPSAILSEVFSSYQGEGLLLGQKQIFVRFSGCDLKCSYCDTVDSQDKPDYFEIHWPGDKSSQEKNPVSPDKLTQIIDSFEKQTGPHHSISCTGGEPLQQTEFLQYWFEDFSPKIPIHLETNGMLPDELSKVIRYIHWIGMDLKLPSVTSYRQITKPSDFWANARAFLKIARHRSVFVKIVVSGSLEKDELREAVNLIASIDKNIPVYLQPVTLKGQEFKYDGEGLGDSLALCKDVVSNVFVIPQVHKALGIR